MPTGPTNPAPCPRIVHKHKPSGIRHPRYPPFLWINMGTSHGHPHLFSFLCGVPPFCLKTRQGGGIDTRVTGLHDKNVTCSVSVLFLSTKRSRNRATLHTINPLFGQQHEPESNRAGCNYVENLSAFPGFTHDTATKTLQGHPQLRVGNPVQETGQINLFLDGKRP